VNHFFQVRRQQLKVIGLLGLDLGLLGLDLGLLLFGGPL